MINTGIFSLSSCSGCLIEFLNLEEKILELMEFLDIKEAQIIKTGNFDGIFDMVFIEGCPTNEQEIEKLRKLRKRSRILVALGTCACYGGVQTMLKDTGIDKAMRIQYGSQIPENQVFPAGLDEYVDVDYMLYGCPFEKSELLELIKDIIMKKEYRNKEYSVCTECILRENRCLLDEGEPCMGPVTRGGCNARCPANGMYCTGCRGEYSDMNTESHQKKLMEIGYSDEEIRDMYNKYYRRLELE